MDNFHGMGYSFLTSVLGRNPGGSVRPSPAKVIERNPHYVFSSISVRGVHRSDDQCRLPNLLHSTGGDRGSGRSLGLGLRYPACSPVDYGSQGLKKTMKKASVIVLAMLTLAFSYNDANAAVIAAITGSSSRADNVSRAWFQLGTGLDSSSFKYAYITYDDNVAGGYITNVQLRECSSSTYATCPNQYVWRVSVITYGSVARTGAGKSTVRLDFTSYSLNGGAITSTPIVLDPTKFYQLTFGFSSSNTLPLDNLSNAVYGITTELTDASGNPIYCSSLSADPTFPCKTGGWGSPFFILADSPVSVPSQWGFATPATVSSGFDLSGADTFCKAQFASSSFGIAQALCNVVGFLFIPSGDSLTQFTDGVQLVNEKVPYSYFQEIKGIYSDVSSSSGTFPSINVSLLGSLGQSTATVSLFSLSAVQTYLPVGLLATLRTIMSSVLWLVFALFVWRTIRKQFR